MGLKYACQACLRPIGGGSGVRQGERPFGQGEWAHRRRMGGSTDPRGLGGFLEGGDELDDLGWGLLGGAGVEGRLGVVLEAQLDRLCELGPDLA
jgi:hypothetical protein